MSKTSVIVRILLATCLFFLATFSYGKFIKWYLIERPGVTYQAFSPSEQFKHFLIFGLCLAAIPIISILLNLKKIKSILISAIIISAFLAAGILVKRTLLALNISRYYSDESYRNSGIEYHLALNKALPEVSMTIGLMIGVGLLILLKNKKFLFRDESSQSNRKLISELLSK